MTCRHVSLTCQLGSTSFLLAGFCRDHSKDRETDELRPRLISVQPVRKKVSSLKHVKLRKQQSTLQLTTIMKIAVIDNYVKPRSNDPNFLANNTQHLFIICCMLLHVVACCSLGQWSKASNTLPNIVQLVNFLWIVKLKYNCSPRNH